jgi:nucleoside-diphosphate-sugar epimerase
LIYIDDLVGAILLALREESALGEAFNISGPDVITWNEYFTKFNEMMGMPPLRTIRRGRAAARSTVTAPLRLTGRLLRDHFMMPLKMLANISETLKNTMLSTENLLKTTPSMETLNLFKKDAVFSSRKAKKLLGYQPQFTINRGLKITVAWLKHHGFLDNL